MFPLTGVAPADPGVPPDRMADTGGGSQLVTAVAPGPGATAGALAWWGPRGGRWPRTGSAPARSARTTPPRAPFRRQGTPTTPTGL
ncbi:hypothetical protein [Streptomyces sp. NPDC006997]|uniref:hypothetical protein n=1 Tax=Streptomyces sp. NPDC006997 TaxID=3155356 RepID=UPI0034058A39